MLHRSGSRLAHLVFPSVIWLAACGSPERNGGDSGNLPAPPDGGLSDGTVAVGPDAAADASVDASLDSGVDATMDATVDAAPDAHADSAHDAATKDGGSDGSTNTSCQEVDAAAFVEAPHGPLPTMVYGDGGILTAPEIVTFTFSNTPNAAALQDFGRTITQTSWFHEVTKDYCINDGGTCIAAGPPGVSVQMTVAAAPVYEDMGGLGVADSGVDMERFVREQVAAAVATHAISPPGPNSLYLFYFPPTSKIYEGDPSQQQVSCSAFGGYHESTAYGDAGEQIAFAILPYCAGTVNDAGGFTDVTYVASHEIAEAVTDPYPGAVTSVTGAGWYLDQANSLDAGAPTAAQIRNQPWGNAVYFGEVGDNCGGVPHGYLTLDGGALVTRVWSRSEAALGHNPCVPVPAGEAYYNASTDKVLYVAEVGSTFTVDVSAFTDHPRPSWHLNVYNGTPTTATVPDGGGPLQYLSFEFVGQPDAGGDFAQLACVNNGTTAQLRVTLLADPAKDPSLVSSELWPEADGLIYSMDDNGTGDLSVGSPYRIWPFAVVTPAIAASIGQSDAGVLDVSAGRSSGQRRREPPMAQPGTLGGVRRPSR